MANLVITTDASDRYHRDENCWAFRAGRDGSEIQGYELHGVTRMSVAEAEQRGRTPCGVCC